MGLLAVAGGNAGEHGLAHAAHAELLRSHLQVLFQQLLVRQPRQLCMGGSQGSRAGLARSTASKGGGEQTGAGGKLVQLVLAPRRTCERRRCAGHQASQLLRLLWGRVKACRQQVSAVWVDPKPLQRLPYLRRAACMQGQAREPVSARLQAQAGRQAGRQRRISLKGTHMFRARQVDNQLCMQRLCAQPAPLLRRQRLVCRRMQHQRVGHQRRIRQAALGVQRGGQHEFS